MRFHAQGHQHRGPIDGVGGENVLANQVDIRRPELIERRFFRQVFEGRDIIHQRVEPDIRDVIFIKRQLDAPGES